MIKMYRALLLMGTISILFFISLRFYHFIKWKQTTGITLVLHQKTCLKPYFKPMPKKILTSRKICLIKGAYIVPGLFSDVFHLLLLNGSSPPIKDKWVINFYRPEKK